MGALPSNLEAGSEASLFRAGPKDLASRIRPILRHTQPQRANPDDQRTPVIAAGVRQLGLALALGAANLFGHLRLDQRFDSDSHEIFTARTVL